MARRKVADRRELRKQADAAEALGKSEAKPKKAAAKKAAVKKPATRRKSTKKKAVAQRMRKVWGVFDNGNQQVAVFPYPERAAADKKAAELTEKGRGAYFVQPVKEPILEGDDEVEVEVVAVVEAIVEEEE